MRAGKRKKVPRSLPEPQCPVWLGWLAPFLFARSLRFPSGVSYSVRLTKVRPNRATVYEWSSKLLWPVGR
jgi:hypothetical protein